MAHQYTSGQSGYLGLAAKAAASLAQGETRSKDKKNNDLAGRIQGEAIKAIGVKLLSSNGSMSSGQPRGTGELVNRLSTWHQSNRGAGNRDRSENRGFSSIDGYERSGGARAGNYGGSYNDNGYGNSGMSGVDGYNYGGGYNGNGYENRRMSGADGYKVWSNNSGGGYGYNEGRGGNYGDVNGWNDPGTVNRGYGYESQGYAGDALGSRGQGSYGNGDYSGYGNRGGMNGRYNYA